MKIVYITSISFSFRLNKFSANTDMLILPEIQCPCYFMRTELKSQTTLPAFSVCGWVQSGVAVIIHTQSKCNQYCIVAKEELAWQKRQNLICSKGKQFTTNLVGEDPTRSTHEYQ